MEINNSQPPQQSKKETSLPPNVPQQQLTSLTNGRNKKYLLIGVVVVVAVLAIGVAAFAWFRITTPQTEQKVIPLANTSILPKKEAQVVCGNPAESLDISHMAVSEFVPSLVVNEWYVDPANSQESFIELRNISTNPFITDGIEIIINDPALITNTIPRVSSGGVLPVQKLEPGCLIVLKQEDLIPRQEAEGWHAGNAHSSGKIDGKYLILGSREGNGGPGQLEYLASMQTGYSVSLTSAGKYVAAPKTPGQYNNATVKPAFQPSAATIKYFKEIVPYIPRSDSNQRIIAKWDRTEVPIGVMDTSAPEDRTCIETAVKELRKLTGLTMPGKSFDTKQGLLGLRRAINIFFVPPAQFPDWARVGEDNTRGAAQPTWHGGEDTNHIDDAEIFINPSLSAQERCQIIYRGLGRSIGIMRNGKSHPESMFNETWPSTAGYSAIDQDIIRMLYDRLIEPGDTLEDINRVFPG